MVRVRIVPQVDSDVIVAGAGPAGAAAAFHVASAGLKVILIDQQKFPRDKVCGDFVGPAALVELEKMGIPDLPEFRRANVIRQAALYLDGRQLISWPLPEVEGLPAHGVCIRRLEFDQYVLEAAGRAGAQLYEGHRVTSFETDREGVTVYAEGPGGLEVLRCQLLIGADGGNSTVARLLRGSPPPRQDRIVAVRAYFEGIEGPADQVDLYFTGQSFPGYYWLFPTGPASANVGVGMPLETMPRQSSQFRELLLELVENDAALHRRLSGATMAGKIVGWPLTTYNPRLPLIAERVMLVGDAAGLINPLNGEGIQYALASGRWAAEIAADGLARRDLSRAALSAYVTRVEQQLRYDRALSRLIIRFICNRSLNPVWFEALRIIVARARSDPEYARITGGILAGLVPARDAVSVKVIRSTLEQAALSGGLGMFVNVLRGPRHLARLGLDTVRAGFDAAYSAVTNPLDFLDWSLGVALSSVELAGQVVKNVVQAPTRTEFAHRPAQGKQPGGSVTAASPLRPTAARITMRSQ